MLQWVYEDSESAGRYWETVGCNLEQEGLPKLAGSNVDSNS